MRFAGRRATCLVLGTAPRWKGQLSAAVSVSSCSAPSPVSRLLKPAAPLPTTTITYSPLTINPDHRAPNHEHRTPGKQENNYDISVSSSGGQVGL